jgi:hypothetical protein
MAGALLSSMMASAGAPPVALLLLALLLLSRCACSGLRLAHPAGPRRAGCAVAGQLRRDLLPVTAVLVDELGQLFILGARPVLVARPFALLLRCGRLARPKKPADV